jgi:3-oxoacyl-[acyl-carrier-protein] synthase II
MTLEIAGLGWVTPLGSGILEVWQRLLAGEEAVGETLADRVVGNPYPVFRVPQAALEHLPAHPRLRRASAISRFAAAAGLNALKDCGLTLDHQAAKRIALVFAVANGGVIYTRRFYHDIVTSGAAAASPLLFPETVFNAAASHLASIIGITGTSYTLVGDGSVGLSAIRMAEDLLSNEELDYCLVVGAEEADWLLCDAYQKWRLLRFAPPIEPFHKPAKGTVLSEGAGALLLGREGTIKIEATHPGSYYSTRREASGAVNRLLEELGPTGGRTAVISGANGTFVDDAELSSITKSLSDPVIYAPKAALGDGVGAGSLWQVIVGAQALRSGQLPPILHAPSSFAFRPSAASTAFRDVVVLNCGLSQQISGLRLSGKSASNRAE